MTTIRFGKACDGTGCKVYYNNYDCGDILSCSDCGRDLCAVCRWITQHEVIREVCCDECPGPEAACDPESIAAWREIFA